MICNQTISEENAISFIRAVGTLLSDFRPYVTTYKERKEKGWYKIYTSENSYVETISHETLSRERLHHLAWAELDKTKQRALVDYIKNCSFLDTKKALEVFTAVTGIKAEDDSKKRELMEKANELIQKAQELKDQANQL